ncbi:MAG: TonB C-terminal domain-containing protein [Victivallaceae bacterium]
MKNLWLKICVAATSAMKKISEALQYVDWREYKRIGVEKIQLALTALKQIPWRNLVSWQCIKSGFVAVWRDFADLIEIKNWRSVVDSKDELLSGKVRKRIVFGVLSGHVCLLFIPLLIMLVLDWNKPEVERYIQVEMLPMGSEYNPGGSPEADNTPPKPTPRPQPKPPKPRPKPPKPRPKPPKPQPKPPKPQPKPPKPPIKTPVRNTSDDAKSDDDSLENFTNAIDARSRESRNPSGGRLGNGDGRGAGKATTDAYEAGLGDFFQQRWNTPSKQELQNPDVAVRVEITIAGDGKIRQYRIMGWSGDEYMDNSIRKLLQVIRQVPAPPGGRDFITVFSFKITD